MRNTSLVGRLAIVAMVAVGALSAAPQFVQVTSIDFLAACNNGGCGGEFGGVTGTTNPPTTPLNLFCIDLQNDINIPSGVYSANFSSITSGADLSDTRYGRTSSTWDGDEAAAPIPFRYDGASFGLAGISQLQRYQMIAWLVDQYPGSAGTTADQIQSAIWQVNDTVPPTGEEYQAVPVIAGSQAFLTSAASFVAANASNDAYWSKFRVVTNTAPIYIVGQNPSQEFLTIVPEPMVPLVFMISMFIAAVMLRRHRRTKEQA